MLRERKRIGLPLGAWQWPRFEKGRYGRERVKERECVREIVCVCVCICDRVWVCVCVCQSEREKRQSTTVQCGRVMCLTRECQTFFLLKKIPFNFRFLGCTSNTWLLSTSCSPYLIAWNFLSDTKESIMVDCYWKAYQWNGERRPCKWLTSENLWKEGEGVRLVGRSSLVLLRFHWKALYQWLTERRLERI